MLRIGLLLLLLAAVCIVISLLLRRPRREARPVVANPKAALPAAGQVLIPSLSSHEVRELLHRLAFGVPGLERMSSQDHAEVAEAIEAEVESSSSDLRHAPRRPLLLPQLLRAINDSEVSRRELSGIITRDPTLAANLLKLANSAIYRANSAPIESVDRAVAALGTEGIRSLVAKALIQPVFRVNTSAFPRFPEFAWEHSFISASAAEIYAPAVESSDPFAAQLLVLLLGLGEIVVFRMSLDQYARRPELVPNAAVIADLIDGNAARVARRVAADWELSERMLEALDDAQTSLGRSLSFGRLAGALVLLRANGVVDDEACRSALLANGLPRQHLNRVWTHITAR